MISTEVFGEEDQGEELGQEVRWLPKTSESTDPQTG